MNQKYVKTIIFILHNATKYYQFVGSNTWKTVIIRKID